jgi:FtsP/CotA-like multicopper oxidase with cupredoxin domain
MPEREQAVTNMLPRRTAPRVHLRLLLASAGLIGLSILAAGARRSPGSMCILPQAPGDSVGITTYCAELIPVPELRTVHGVLELTPAAGPLVAVTVDGHARYEISVRIDGLPEPSSLGPYSAFVAWVTDLSTSNLRRLGRVGNGESTLGIVGRNQFRILVTAESNPDAESRSGRIVLRGTSPSVRLLAHRDLIMAAAPGFGRAGMGGMHAAGGWTMPPMDPSMPVMPGIGALLPDVDPYLPDSSGSDLPEARPSQPIQLEDGDTLRLEAGRVRREIGGHSLTMYAFNGQQPGPLIRVERGATIVVEFHNALDLPSSVHWHGVRLDNRYDGAVGVTQAAVEPGGRFEYRVHFRDEGIYWYHPHVREDIEQDLGLYGNMLAAPTDAKAYGPANREEVITLDDFLLAEDGPVPWGRQAPTHTLMGRFGNIFLTNGEPHYTLHVRSGDVVRFFLTNVANSRIFNVSFGEAAMKIVGGDIGRYEREEWVSSIVLAPAERAIVDVRFGRPGRITLTNRVQSANHMLGTFTPEVDTLGTVIVDTNRSDPDLASSFEQLRTNTDVVADIDRYRPWFDRAPDRRLVLRMDASKLSGALMSTMLVGYAPPIDWNDGMPMMNWLMTGNDIRWTLQDAETLRENTDIDWHFHVGDIVKIEIANPPEAFHPMSHPIHLHGQRFLVVKRNGRPASNLVWKDTVIVPVGETVQIVLDLSNPGRWMLHCHIAEHLGAGMMMTFDVSG